MKASRRALRRTIPSQGNDRYIAYLAETQCRNPFILSTLISFKKLGKYSLYALRSRECVPPIASAVVAHAARNAPSY